MLTLLSLFACAPKEPVEDPADHACEHVGASEATLPSGDTTGNAVVLPMDGEPYTAELRDSVPGYLSIQIEKATEAVLFAGTADVVLALFHGTEAIPLPEPAPVEACDADIPEHFDLDFEIGTWYLQVGPAAVDEVWLSLAEAEGHAHDEGEE